MSEALPLLDSATALGRLRGKTDLYRRLLQQAEPHRDAATRLEAAWNRSDWAEVTGIAHRLAGVAASLGAERLCVLARRIEQEASDGVPDTILLPWFSTVLSDTFAAMDAYLDQEAQASATAESWCQVRQTVQMLELAAGQIHVAMRDSSVSVEVLMGAFSTMVAQLQGLEARFREQGEGLGAGGYQVSAAMDEALMALQFYDRLAQRLEHVEQSLGHLGELLANPERVASPPAWNELQEAIRSRYTTEEERIMFAAVMGGMPVTEAIAHYKETVLARTGSDGSSEVELF